MDGPSGFTAPVSHNHIGGPSKRVKKKKIKRSTAGNGSNNNHDTSKIRSPVILPSSARGKNPITPTKKQLLSPRSPIINLDMDDDKDNFSLQEMRSPSFPSPPPGGSIAKSGSFVSRSTPRGGRLYRENPDMPTSPRSAIRPASSTLPQPETTFNKAINTIATLKIHNHALRRRQQQLKKAQIWKELKSLQDINKVEVKPTAKYHIYEAIAAWKLRYFVEFIRLRALRKEMKDAYAISRDKDAEIAALSQLISATKGEIGNIVDHHRQHQELLSRSKEENSTLQKEIRDLRDGIDNLRKKIAEQEKVIVDQDKKALEEQKTSADQSLQMDVLRKELEITRLTCQELIKKNLTTETDLKDFYSQINTQAKEFTDVSDKYRELLESHRALQEQFACYQEDREGRWTDRFTEQIQRFNHLSGQYNHVVDCLQHSEYETKILSGQLEESEVEKKRLTAEHDAMAKLTADLALQVQSSRRDHQQTQARLLETERELKLSEDARRISTEKLTSMLAEAFKARDDTSRERNEALEREKRLLLDIAEVKRQLEESKASFDQLESDHVILKGAFLDIHKRVYSPTKKGSSQFPESIEMLIRSHANLVEEEKRAAKQVAEETDRAERRDLEDKLLQLMKKLEDKVDHFETIQLQIAQAPLSPTKVAPTTGATPFQTTPATDTQETVISTVSAASNQPVSTPASKPASAEFQNKTTLNVVAPGSLSIDDVRDVQKRAAIEEHLHLENIFHDIRLQMRILQQEVSQEEANITYLTGERDQYQEILNNYFKEFEAVYQRPIEETDYDENTLAYLQEIKAVGDDIAIRQEHNETRMTHIEELRQQSRTLNQDLEANADAFRATYDEHIVQYYPTDLVVTLQAMEVPQRRYSILNDQNDATAPTGASVDAEESETANPPLESPEAASVSSLGDRESDVDSSDGRRGKLKRQSSKRSKGNGEKKRRKKRTSASAPDEPSPTAVSHEPTETSNPGDVGTDSQRLYSPFDGHIASQDQALAPASSEADQIYSLFSSSAEPPTILYRSPSEEKPQHIHQSREELENQQVLHSPALPHPVVADRPPSRRGGEAATEEEIAIRDQVNQAIRRQSLHTIDAVVRAAVDKMFPMETASDANLAEQKNDVVHVGASALSHKVATPPELRPLSRASRPLSRTTPPANAPQSLSDQGYLQVEASENRPLSRSSRPLSRATPPNVTVSPGESESRSVSRARSKGMSGATVDMNSFLRPASRNGDFSSLELVNSSEGASSHVQAESDVFGAVVSSGSKPSSRQRAQGSRPVSRQLSSRPNSTSASPSSNGMAEAAIIDESLPMEVLQAEYVAIKKDLKRWRQEFITANGRPPAVDDFQSLDLETKIKIARRNALKKKLGAGGGGDD